VRRGSRCIIGSFGLLVRLAPPTRTPIGKACGLQVRLGVETETIRRWRAAVGRMRELPFMPLREQFVSLSLQYKCC